MGYNGFIILNKAEGLSSAYALNKIKGKINKEKSGHMGTLDPMASGVLPLALGKSTKLFNYLLDKDKSYEAEFSFGYETDTLDGTGKVMNTSSYIPTLDDIKKVIPNLIGKIDQIPPKFSAKWIDGVRCYERARRGEEFEMKAKTIEIFDIVPDITDKKDTFKFKITCGSGTYIRSICRDIAYMLNTYATMTKLVRTRCGPFDISNSYTLEEISNGNIDEMIISPDKVIKYDVINISKRDYVDCLNGILVSFKGEDGLRKVYVKDTFIGIGEVSNNCLKIVTYINYYEDN